MPAPSRKIGPFSVAGIGLGGMPMSLEGRPVEADSIQVIHAALDGGMTLIDTADSYCKDDDDFNHNEKLIRRALDEWTGDKRAVVVITKGGLERPRGAWTTNARPEHLKQACDQSLLALGVEAIAVYQLHAPDDNVPFEDSVGALAELQQQGKILHVGLSNVGVAHIERAAKIVEVVSVQNRFNPFDRVSLDSGVVAHCEKHGIAFLAHSPVGGHRGKSRVASNPVLRAIGERLGVSPFRVALAWCLAKGPNILPIPGASRVVNAVDSAGALLLQLSAEDVAKIDRLGTN